MIDKMLSVRVSEDIEYKIEKLQDGLDVSREIPKFIILCPDEDECIQ